jgi:hypothetical protein
MPPSRLTSEAGSPDRARVGTHNLTIGRLVFAILAAVAVMERMPGQDRAAHGFVLVE